MTLLYNLLDEPLIRTRLVADGKPRSFSLPGLFVALGHDAVRDFPALRPHQRHPWHAFLVQLAAIALHRAGRSEFFDSEATWKQALLDLTPEHPDGAAWCLIAPHDRPAFMQAPVPGGRIDGWRTAFRAADELDMLVTSKNHDLKAARMRCAEADDWIMALISLQTQEGYGGRDNWGISRMAGGFGCRIALGAVAKGNAGRRWRRDLSIVRDARDSIVETLSLREAGGHELLWLPPWDGTRSLAFSSLDPFYIEICRLVRLVLSGTGELLARANSSKQSRIGEHLPRGATGDAWTPINAVSGEALRIRGNGFHYQLASALLFGVPYRKEVYKQPLAMTLHESDGATGVSALMQAISRGGPMGNKSVTEGYHERHVPLSRTVRNLILRRQTDVLAKVAGERIAAIAELRRVLWIAISTLFNQGADKDFADGVKDKASQRAHLFEQAEDARFFIALNEEIESEQPDDERLQWLLSMKDAAEAVLRHAFTAGPQCGEQRYRAQAAALSRFHSDLRNSKTLPDLANHLRQRSIDKELP
ncbi:type I-E CRISPR-associated protein Cse1/CasA [Candidatus Accumulibacter sp. ACC003]|uniref:type I-E CRISPR-associated protein Cse1/CasA n=1 Tax=Candidatus Accumulibacter sp. ACC003 TaxID=2823334 RepID=UPI0025C2259B|nr:type I-E CRISPR-associated protein Cse1/CasA [Candidatus Accumulibacter sp. ACC003]